MIPIPHDVFYFFDLVQIQALSEEMESLRSQRVVLRKDLQEAAATVRLHVITVMSSKLHTTCF